MQIKLSDWIAHFFAKKHMQDCFMITGGGAMHLNDSFGHHPDIHCIFNHHEQASAMGAEGYARVTGKPGLVCVTSGPGGTNALTGVLGAWMDSIPMIVVSGQIKRETCMRSYPELSLRQLGDQEFDIVGTAKHMTKYAAMIIDPKKVAYHLEKAYYVATHGRKGPVWIDVPLDVQAALIETDDLIHFDPKNPAHLSEAEKRITAMPRPERETVQEVLRRIEATKAPAFLLGNGVRLADARDLLEEVLERFRLPALTEWNTEDLVPYDSEYHVGTPGTVGTRGANFVLQNCDLLISIGARLNIRMVGYNRGDFAKRASMVSVDIDEEELKKPTVTVDLPIHADAGAFLEILLQESASYQRPAAHDTWLAWCRECVEKYPTVLEEYHAETGEKTGINPYVFLDQLFEQMNEDACLACSNGSACVMTFQAAKIKRGQRMFTNSGSASMGYGLPAAIGACYGRRREGGGAGETVLCIEGDGSIMMNLQELQTVQTNHLDVRIIVLNNQGYHSMRQTQKNLFGGPFVGIGADSGLGFPELKKLAEVFSMKYSRIDAEEEAEKTLEGFLAETGPAILEVVVDPKQEFAPKISSRVKEDGTIESPGLEKMAPFLDTIERYRG